MIKETYNIGYATRTLKNLREEYNYYKTWQTNLRKKVFEGDQRYYDDWKYERDDQIWHNRRELKYLESQIREIKKIIKRLSRNEGKHS